MAAVIAFLTDFGLADPYVGQMKGACLQIAPEARLIDITHNVLPFNIIQAGFFLSASVLHYPEETVFINVVDPGVGSERRIVLLRNHNRYFLAPDNGLLGFVLQNVDEQTKAWQLSIPEDLESSTFHGRDVFCRVAGQLASGISPDELATPIRYQGLMRADWTKPRRTGEALVTHVMHIDRFGNCILNLSIGQWKAEIDAWESVEMIHPKSAEIKSVNYYGQLGRGELGILPNSQGYYEICQNRSAASKTLNLTIGHMIRIKP